MTWLDELFLLFCGAFVGVMLTLSVLSVLRPSDAFWRGYLEGSSPAFWWHRIFNGQQ